MTRFRFAAAPLCALAVLFGITAAVAADQTPSPSADQVPPKYKAVQPVPDVPFFFVNDNRLTYSYQFETSDPGYWVKNPNGTYNGKETIQTVALTHFDVWQYGTNFANASFSLAGANDPAAPCTNVGKVQAGNAVECSGAASGALSVRSTFGFNEIFETKRFSYGPLTDVSLIVGGDYGLQNALFASNSKKLVGGLQFSFELPYKGYVNFSPLAYQQWGHDAFADCGFFGSSICLQDGTFKYPMTWAIEMQYAMDLGFLPPSMQYFTISGRAQFIGPRGLLVTLSNQAPTKIEINAEPIRLTFDAGKAFFGKKWSRELDLWVAWRYSHNQYGEDANQSPCTLNGISTGSCGYSTVALGVTAKF
jgi:hypothetical protein